jgi:hypothetical protein
MARAAYCTFTTGCRGHTEKTQGARMIEVSTAAVSATAGVAASHPAFVVHPYASSLPASAVWTANAVASALRVRFLQREAWAQDSLTLAGN